MKISRSKKLAASAVIFLVSNFASPQIMGAESTHTREIAPSAKEYTVMDKGPSVHTGTNQILRLSQSVPFTAKNCISIQSVYSFESNLQRISQLTFTFSQSKVKLSTKPYGDEVSGYVSTALIDTYSGSIAIKKPQNILEKKLQKILSKPKQYNVRPDLINPAITPKIITDNDSKSVYILMAPRDFREVDGPYYTDAMLQEMLVTTYASFKAYAQGFHKAYPGKKVVLHTSYWGIENKNNMHVTTAIQLIAANLAGIDELVFHTAGYDSKPFLDVEQFLLNTKPNSVAFVLKGLVLQSDQNSWYNEKI